MLRTGRASVPVDPAEQDRIRREFADSLRSMPAIQPGAQPAVYANRFDPLVDRFSPGSFGPAGSFGSPAARDSRYSPMDESWRQLYAPPSLHQPGLGHASDQALHTAQGPPVPTADDYRGTRAVQMHNLYLVAETSEGIVIVDQHALHERIMYEQLRTRFTAGTLESQRLLLPETIRVTPQQATLLDEHADLLNQLGIEVTLFGADSVAVQSFPALLKDTQVGPFMVDLLDLLSRQPQHSTAAASAGENGNPAARAAHAEVIIHKVLDLMACKAAVKAGDPLTADEIEALMQQRHLIEKPSSCPHGRPTMLRLTKEDLNRQFKRT
jgi:DNA mismatch repair protein MutL